MKYILCAVVLLMAGCTARDRQAAMEGVKAGWNEQAPPTNAPTGSLGDDLKLLAISTIAYAIGSSGKGVLRKYTSNRS